MWVSGNVTADAFYRLENIDQWSPIGGLAETLEALTPPERQKDAETSVPHQTPETRKLVRLISRGDGTREKPFVVNAPGYVLSKQVQAAMLNTMFGDGTYQPTGTRVYHPSHGQEGENRDLCEHQILVDGSTRSVWFDLSEVTTAVQERKLQSGDKGAALSGFVQEILGLGEKCWFSGGVSHPQSALHKTLYFDESRFFSRTKRWREISVSIPRAPQVAALHNKQQRFMLASLLGIPAVAMFVVPWLTRFAWWHGLVGGTLVGVFTFWQWCPADNPQWKSDGEWKKYPEVAKLLTGGWTDRHP